MVYITSSSLWLEVPTLTGLSSFPKEVFNHGRNHFESYTVELYDSISLYSRRLIICMHTIFMSQTMPGRSEDG